MQCFTVIGIYFTANAVFVSSPLSTFWSFVTLLPYGDDRLFYFPARNASCELLCFMSIYMKFYHFNQHIIYSSFNYIQIQSKKYYEFQKLPVKKGSKRLFRILQSIFH